MAKEEYIPVATDDWYQRRRDDAEGKFFRGVADQGPRKGEGGSTRQGIYCFTAAGKLLTYKNVTRPEHMREVLQQGLTAWKKLPGSQRQPGAVQIEDPGELDSVYVRKPPERGLIISVFTRALDRDDKGELCDASCKVGGGDEAARDHLWLTESEWRSLVPQNPKVGDQFPLPAPIATRILRFHLVDNTRGEPPFWQRNEIRTSDLKLTVKERDAAGITLHLDGVVLISTNKDAVDPRGYDAQLMGRIHYSETKHVIDRFDLVAIGDHWGEGTFTPNARPGQTPLGVAFEIASGNSPADHVPPQGARVVSDYFGRR